MLNKYQAIYTGASLAAPSAGVVMLYALGSGTIKNVRVKVKTANGAGGTRFNLSKNGVDQFTTELSIGTGQTSVSVTGQSINVAFGDILVLTLESISAGGVTSPIALQLESEEPLILSAADVIALQTALSLSGSNTGDQTISDATITTTDITTNNATTAKHGFLKKLSNAATEYLDGTGNWSTPAGGGGGAAELDDLSDVVISSPTSGEILGYNGTNWVNSAPSGGGSGAYAADVPPISPSAYDDEFNSTTLDPKWTKNYWSEITGTAVPAVNFESIDTKVRSVYLLGLSGGNFSLTQAFVPGSADFNFRAALYGLSGYNYATVGLAFKDGAAPIPTIQANQPNNYIFPNFGYGGGSYRFSYNARVGGGTPSNVNNPKYIYTPEVYTKSYIHVQRVGGAYQGWYSPDGVVWFDMFAGYPYNPPSLTVSHMELIFAYYSGTTAEFRCGVDWIRSNVEFLST